MILSPLPKPEVGMELASEAHDVPISGVSLGVLPGEPQQSPHKCLPARTAYTRFQSFPAMLRTSLAFARRLLEGQWSCSSLAIATVFSRVKGDYHSVRIDGKPQGVDCGVPVCPFGGGAPGLA